VGCGSWRLARAAIRRLCLPKSSRNLDYLLAPAGALANSVQFGIVWLRAACINIPGNGKKYFRDEAVVARPEDHAGCIGTSRP
jgi:hypothetical protein